MLVNILWDTHIDGLVQDCSNPSALKMELLQSCAKPSIYCSHRDDNSLPSAVARDGWTVVIGLQTEQILIYTMTATP